MDRTDISGGTFPLVIDQEDITAPRFPRGREWWEQFVPVNWITVEVRDDGTVALDARRDRCGFAGGEWVPDGTQLTGAQFQRQRVAVARWIGGAIGRHLKD